MWEGGGPPIVDSVPATRLDELGSGMKPEDDVGILYRGPRPVWRM